MEGGMYNAAIAHFIFAADSVLIEKVGKEAALDGKTEPFFLIDGHAYHRMAATAAQHGGI